MKKGCKISDYCMVIAGQSPDGKAYNTDGKGMEFHQGKKAFGINTLEESGVWTTTITKVAEAGDILMSVRAPVGPTNITNRKICIGRGLAAIRCGKNILSSYVLYALKNIEKNIVGNNGAVFNSINKKMIEDIPIPNADLDEQHQIVSYLDTTFANIEKLKSNASKALSEAKALFQAALAEAMMPKEGWEEKTLGELCLKIGSGATPRGGKKIYLKEGTSFVRSLNVHCGYFKNENLAFIDDNEAKKLDGVELKAHDVLFNITGASIARCCIVPINILPARVNQHVAIIRIKDNLLESYLCYLLNSPYYQKKLLSIGETGSTRQAITKADLERFVISFPTTSQQQEIVRHLDTLSSKVRQMEENYRKTLAECDALKQAILRDVF